ncbi:LOW QUALITY PROTEIN: uncharacterized protein Dana_GF12579 [Drosophila ananassae]|uniref:Uncharacterized protein n=1 Tax=Drosophila ananassae TaxID=7217 RepID=B3MFW8_DROAN|nr:LOW QUALITY PROTEIN: uncharacterized protein Dana_GF12579 [Drosophila ananassae]
MIFALLLVGLAVALAYSFYFNTYTYWARKGVPHEKPLPFIGNLKGIGIKYHFRDINQRIYNKFKGQGPIAGLFTFMTRTAMVIDLDLVRQVLIKDFNYFHDRGLFSNPRNDPLTGHLLTLEGEEWKAMRQKLTPVFSSGKIKHMSEVVIEVGHRLADAMDKEVATASVEAGDVEIKDLCARYTTDVIGTCAFGLECNSLADEKAEFRTMGREIFQKPRNSLPVHFFILNNRSIAQKLRLKIVRDDITEFFMSAVKNTVEYRLKNNIKRNDFMDQLIQLRAEDQDRAKKAKGIDLSHGLTIEQIAAQAFVFFVAGFETSSSTMAFCLYELALQPNIQDRVREEIETVLGKSDKISYDAIAEMTYLEQVIAETLRKHPILPHVTREANQDYKLPNTDIVIDNGTSVLIPISCIHHDPEIYPNPEEFDPSRFDPEVVKSRHPMAYLPFGEGPRNCIGLRFGKLQSKIGLVSLLRRFRFSPSKRTEIPLILGNKNFTLNTKNGMHLKVERI